MNNKSLKKRFGNYKRNIQQGSVTDFYSTPQSTSHNTHHSQKHFLSNRQLEVLVCCPRVLQHAEAKSWTTNLQPTQAYNTWYS